MHVTIIYHRSLRIVWYQLAALLILTGPDALGDFSIHRHRTTLKGPEPVLVVVVVHAVDVGQELAGGALEVCGLVILVDPSVDRRGRGDAEQGQYCNEPSPLLRRRPRWFEKPVAVATSG